MLEIFDYVICLAVGEGCVVWVDGEVSLTSHDSSVVSVRLEMADAREMVDESVCLLFE